MAKEQQKPNESLASCITEAVCDQFGDWMAEPVPFDTKVDIYYRVLKEIEDAV